MNGISQKNGKSQPLDYFNDLDPANQRKLLYLIKRIGDFGRISDMTKFRNEKELALRSKKDFEERNKRGEYYE
ncbi:MAG: hypothetical protein PQJ59_14350 [Spirochaetales bacterium]|nr:hypothetical protein [Spirochaetales bacterium]